LSGLKKSIVLAQISKASSKIMKSLLVTFKRRHVLLEKKKRHRGRVQEKIGKRTSKVLWVSWNGQINKERKKEIKGGVKEGTYRGARAQRVGWSGAHEP